MAYVDHYDPVITLPQTQEKLSNELRDVAVELVGRWFREAQDEWEAFVNESCCPWTEAPCGYWSPRRVVPVGFSIRVIGAAGEALLHYRVKAVFRPSRKYSHDDLPEPTVECATPGGALILYRLWWGAALSALAGTPEATPAGA